MESENELMYPAESTVGDQSLRGISPEISKTAAGWLAPEELRRRISALAYELYLRRGKRRGHDLEDWLEAEAFVLSQLPASVGEVLWRDEAGSNGRRRG